MGAHIPENGTITAAMAKASSLSPTEQSMRVVSCRTKPRAQEFSLTRMGQNMRENGRITNGRGKVFWSG